MKYETKEMSVFVCIYNIYYNKSIIFSQSLYINFQSIIIREENVLFS